MERDFPRFRVPVGQSIPASEGFIETYNQCSADEPTCAMKLSSTNACISQKADPTLNRTITEPVLKSLTDESEFGAAAFRLRSMNTSGIPLKQPRQPRAVTAQDQQACDRHDNDLARSHCERSCQRLFGTVAKGRHRKDDCSLIGSQ